MDKNEISIRKINAINIVNTKMGHDNRDLALTFNSECMSLGYVMSEELLDAIASQPESKIKELYNTTIATLRSMKGADVRYKPMYPNFPKQVMDASLIELYTNALVHYWSFGLWMPNYEEVPRELAFEKVEFKKLDLCSNKEFNDIFTKILSSNTSITQYDKFIVEWFLESRKVNFPEEIPFKENLCIVAGKLLDEGKSIEGLAKTATDVLRIATYISGTEFVKADISLASNTKFKSFKRSVRRELLSELEAVINTDDIFKHKKKWVKLFHSLHVGEYKDTYKYSYQAAQLIRSKSKGYKTFSAKVEKAIADNDNDRILHLLQLKPGEFARRLDHVLRISNDTDAVIKSFASVLSDVSTKVLLQVSAFMKNRSSKDKIRVAYPKGLTSKAVLLKDLKKMDNTICNKVVSVINEELNSRFNEQESLNKVWIDPKLESCPVPLQLRNASEGSVVARGTRMPLKEGKDTVRLFIYWVGQDIDLSATFHDEDFKVVERVAYYNLKSSKYNACHSGDITYAPEGAAEFIDIDIPSAAKVSRYLVMNVNVYNGPTFSNHETCYAGWMMKEKPNAGEVYDAKLVDQKVNVTSNSRMAIPVVFDLETREAIWTDLAVSSFGSYENVDNNKASIRDVLKATVMNAQPNLKDLFTMHAFSRGEIVTDKEDADTIFSLSEGVTPFDIDTINSEYLK